MMAVVVMGVSGAGKTTVGSALADRLGAEFIEGDRFHPPENIAKMSRGEPLDDADRWPWLDRLGAEVARRGREGRPVVLACSALKRAYRDRLRRAWPALRFVYLRGDLELIQSRLAARHGHFMPAGLLESQFAALEAPAPDEAALTADIRLPTQELVGDLASRLADGDRRPAASLA
ncbi:MAG TPA: gluconokinase [Stellaceae bacterium]|nr:gluconokinase [Stellaceae bacterium]